jgi:hypothetical protein
MEVSVLDADTSVVLAREWVNFGRESDQVLTATALAAPASRLRVLAYPNIVRWKDFDVREVALDAVVPLKEEGSIPLTGELKPKKPIMLQALQSLAMEFELRGPWPVGAVGTIELKDAAGAVVETLGF